MAITENKKSKAIELAITQIDKQFGKGSIMRLGGNQVSMAGGEIYQALERGVIDGAEFSTPNVDYSGGFHQVTKFWATPGWHQSASVFGVMINKASWDALSPETQEDLKIAAQANLIWSLSFTEKRATEAYQQFKDAGIEITRYDDETLARVQELANEVIIETACENPASAKVYLSQGNAAIAADWDEF